MLKLSLVGSSPPAPGQELVKTVAGGSLTIGRGIDNGWVMIDPNRTLSKSHCVIAKRGGAWELTDTSTNGVFVNNAVEPVGRGRAVRLQSGDSLYLGALTVRVDIVSDGEAPDMAPTSPAASYDPFFGAGASSLPGTPLIPADDDMFADLVHAQSDHLPADQVGYRPPAVSGAAIPDDWDVEASRPNGDVLLCRMLCDGLLALNRRLRGASSSLLLSAANGDAAYALLRAAADPESLIREAVEKIAGG